MAFDSGCDEKQLGKQAATANEIATPADLKEAGQPPVDDTVMRSMSPQASKGDNYTGSLDAGDDDLAPQGSAEYGDVAVSVGPGDEGDRARADVEYKVYTRRWFGVVQLTLLNIVVSWDWLTFSPVSQFAATYYDTTESTINWLATAFMFSFVFISPVVIYILHWGPKPSIITAAVLVLAGNWIRFAGSHSGGGGIFGVVMFGQILTGLAQPFVLSAPTRYSDLWFTSRGRVGATALMSLANPFGAALGQLVVPFICTKPSEVSSMVLYVSVIASVCAIPSFFVPAEPPTPPAPSGKTPKASLRESLRLCNSLECWLLLVPFAVYVGFFNSISSLLNQILMPYGFSSDDAGIAGAVLIVVGLVASAVASPLLDRTKQFLLSIKIFVPVIGLMYFIFIWMPATRGVAGPYAVLALLGASSFSLLPVALEYLGELSHPCSPEVTSTFAWAGGQLLGGCFILISDALKAGPEANPPVNMSRSLIFTAVIALAVVPLPLALGMFGRQDNVVLRRVRSDDRHLEHEHAHRDVVA